MPETNVADLKTEPPRKLSGNSGSLELGQFNRERMAVTLPAGWTFEDTLKPEFWSQVVYRFKAENGKDYAGRLIEVYTEDHAFYAELYVRAVRERDIIVAVARDPVYFGPRDMKTPGYEVRWNLGRKLHEIIRKSDKEIVGAEKTRELAQEWIDKTIGTARAA